MIRLVFDVSPCPQADVPEDPEEKKLYNATKELVLPVLRQVPIEQSIRKLNLMDVLEAGIKHAAATNNKELSNQINKVTREEDESEAFLSLLFFRFWKTFPSWRSTAW
jgi:hypothetical protein